MERLNVGVLFCIFLLYRAQITTCLSETVRRNSLLPDPAKACGFFFRRPAAVGAVLWIHQVVMYWCQTVLLNSKSQPESSRTTGETATSFPRLPAPTTGKVTPGYRVPSQRKSIGNLKTLFCQQSILFCWREKEGIKVKRVSERCSTLILKNCLDQLSTHHRWINTQVFNYKPMCFESFSSIWYQFCIKILRKQTTKHRWKMTVFPSLKLSIKTKVLQELYSIQH